MRVRRKILNEAMRDAATSTRVPACSIENDHGSNTSNGHSVTFLFKCVPPFRCNFIFGQTQRRIIAQNQRFCQHTP